MLLKQSTTVTVQMGPFLDITDGVTEETGVSVVVEISKAGAAYAARNSGTAITHDAEGWYRVELNATDTNTLGRLVAKAHASATHIPVWHEFFVIDANAYEALVTGTAFHTDNKVLLAGTTHTSAVVPTVSTLTGHTAQTGDSFARLGAPAGASISADIATVDTVADGIKAKTDSLTFTTANKVDARVDAVGGTAVTSPNDLKADVTNLDAAVSSRATVADILTTQMTEAYAAAGVAPTLAQALFMIQQRVTEFAISGTTITGKKLDGSTTAFTLTTDDATSPTSSTRAT